MSNPNPNPCFHPDPPTVIYKPIFPSRWFFWDLHASASIWKPASELSKFLLPSSSCPWGLKCLASRWSLWCSHGSAAIWILIMRSSSPCFHLHDAYRSASPCFCLDAASEVFRSWLTSTTCSWGVIVLLLIHTWRWKDAQLRSTWTIYEMKR